MECTVITDKVITSGTYLGQILVPISDTCILALCRYLSPTNFGTYIGHVYFGAAAIDYVIRMTVSVRKKIETDE